MPTTDASDLELKLLAALATLRQARDAGNTTLEQIAEARLNALIDMRVAGSKLTMIGASPASPAAPEPSRWTRVEP